MSFAIPHNATPEEIEAARPDRWADPRCQSEPLASPFISGTATMNTAPEPPPEPDPVRRLRGLVAIIVNPMMYDYQQGFLSFANAADFCAGTIEGMRGYAAEMELDIEAAEAEARRQLEGSYGRDICWV